MALPARISRAPIARMNKVREGDSPDHLKWLATLWCARCGRRGCVGHHPRLMSMGAGKSLKAEDRYAYPLDDDCHTLKPWARHSIEFKGDEIDWCALNGIQYRELGNALWRYSGDDDQAFKVLGMYGAPAVRVPGVMVR